MNISRQNTSLFETKIFEYMPVGECRIFKRLTVYHTGLFCFSGGQNVA